MSRLTSALTGAVRSVNRTDAATLSAAQGSLAEMLRSTPEQLSACPGIGPTKVGMRPGEMLVGERRRGEGWLLVEHAWSEL